MLFGWGSVGSLCPSFAVVVETTVAGTPLSGSLKNDLVSVCFDTLGCIVGRNGWFCQI